MSAEEPECISLSLFLNCTPPLPLNYSLPQPLVHLSLFTCSFVMIFTPEASKRPSLTNLLINSSENTNVHPIHNSRVLPQNPTKLISKHTCYQAIMTGFCLFLGGQGERWSSLHPATSFFFFCKCYIFKWTEPILYHCFITFDYY